MSDFQAAAMCRDNGLGHLESHFSASNFLKCQPDATGMVLTADFQNFVLHKEPLMQMVGSSWFVRFILLLECFSTCLWGDQYFSVGSLIS